MTDVRLLQKPKRSGKTLYKCRVLLWIVIMRLYFGPSLKKQ
jgi:hypothetical protein